MADDTPTQTPAPEPAAEEPKTETKATSSKTQAKGNDAAKDDDTPKTFNPGDAPTKDAPNGQPYEGVSPDFQR